MRVKVVVEQKLYNMTIQTYHIGMMEYMLKRFHEATVYSARGKLMDGVLFEILNVIL
jgi:hypothetical protein